jgi:hypothetical protein
MTTRPTASQSVDNITNSAAFQQAAQESVPRLSTILPARLSDRKSWLKANTTLPDTVIDADGIHSHVVVMNALVEQAKKWKNLERISFKKSTGLSFYTERYVAVLKFLRLELDLVNAAEKASGYSERWGIELSETEKW